jgi:hypothetical protein
MSGFRVPRKILKEAVGAYVNGRWVAGARSIGSTSASCQPIVVGQDLKALPEGRHVSDFIKFYTNDKLQLAADGEGTQPDIIVFNGYGFEIVSEFVNQNAVISHYKYVAVKIFKFTTDSDWTTGVLKRP